MIEEAKSKNIFYKLKNINDFWNKIAYKKDIEVWRKKDYRASPFELLSVGAGDSEDFVIAKYFSLIKVGVPYEKLKIIYVKMTGKDLKEDKHMVLTYHHKPNAIPVVLDNIDKTMKLATDRKDLKLLF